MRRELVTVFTIATLFLVHATANAKPAVFENLSAQAAVAKAREDGRIVVIDFTAEWCGPCKQMDKVTWSNASVVEWLRENAVAIQVDVDHDRATAGRFRVSAMPTVVVMRDGKEIDRAVGFKNADAFLKWMFALKGGKTEADLRKEEVEAMPDGPEKAATLMQERMSNAQNFARMGRNDEALEEYLWLWRNIHKDAPGMVGVRGSFLASDIQRFAAAYPKAKAAFEKERDALTPLLRERPIQRETLDDWIVLNEIVGDQKATLAFVDGFKSEPGAAETLVWHEFRLTPLLIAHGRWADAGAIINPGREISMIKQIRAFHAGRPEMADMPDMSGMEIDRFATHYAALLAAGRKADAQGLAEAAFDLYDKPRVQVAFVEGALKADQATREHREWLDEAAAAGHEARWTRESLEKALASSKRR